MDHKLSNLFKGDKVIWMVFFFLCIISLVEVFSASSTLTFKSGNYAGPIIKHSIMLLMGLGVTVLVMNVPCRFFKLCTLLLLGASVISLVLVLAVGESINGANRVLSIMGFTFQPSEIAKGTVVLYVAQVLSAMQTPDGAEPKAIYYILIISVPIIGLIFVENLSTAALLFGVVVLMMFIGRIPMRQLGTLLGGIALLLGLALGAILMLGHDTRGEKPEMKKTEVLAQGPNAQRDSTSNGGGAFHRFDTWKTRIVKFVDDKPVAPEDYDLDKDRQVAYANIAIVGSNVIGRGPGNSVERDFLSQAYSDFIFAIIIEEMGIGGAIFVVFLYVVLLFRTARIAKRCENNFPAFLAMGLAMLLAVQAMFNMMVAVGLAPVTGQPLPLISRGGTSTIINCAYIGIILSVSRTAKKNKAVPAVEAAEEE